MGYEKANGSGANGVAIVIGKNLSEGGAQVNVLPIQVVSDHAPYQAVAVAQYHHFPSLPDSSQTIWFSQ